jgi:Ca-activated chloride channel family protein
MVNALNPLLLAALAGGLGGAVTGLAEWRHRRRQRALGGLAGPARAWTRLAPALAVAGMAAVVGGAVLLMLLPPAPAGATNVEVPADRRHLVIVLDVSPSMNATDAGRDGRQTRGDRGRDLLHAALTQLDHPALRTSIVALANGAIPVAIDTADREVLANILDDLPLAQAFPRGPTTLTAAITAAADLGRGWAPGTASLLLVSDGDSLPGTPPPCPPAFADALVLGLGDSGREVLVDGHPSRQDSDGLQRLAVRLHGVYFDANRRDPGRERLARLAVAAPQRRSGDLTQLALALIAVGALLIAGLPATLRRFAAPRLPLPPRPP